MHTLKKLALGLAVALAAVWAPSASAYSGYLDQNGCAMCHGSTFSACNGCHAHGTHKDNAKADINLVGSLDKTSVAPGETITVTLAGGYRGGENRAVVFDAAGNEVARAFGVSPIGLAVAAPQTGGTYQWTVAWYGNKYDAAGASFGAGTSTTIRAGYFTDDPRNGGHGWQVVALPAFTVVAAPPPPAPAPKIAVAPTSLPFGTIDVGSTSSQTTVVSNGGTADLTVSVAPCAQTSPEFTASPAAFTVAPGGNATVTVAYQPADATADTGCIAVQSNDSATGTVNVAVTGAGRAVTTPPPATTDVDITRFNVARRLDISRGATATPTVSIANVGTTPATFTMTVQSPAAGYSESQSVTIAAGATAKVKFPVFTPTTVGVFTFTASFDDGNPDVDSASVAVKVIP